MHELVVWAFEEGDASLAEVRGYVELVPPLVGHLHFPGLEAQQRLFATPKKRTETKKKNTKQKRKTKTQKQQNAKQKRKTKHKNKSMRSGELERGAGVTIRVRKTEKKKKKTRLYDGTYSRIK